MNLEWMDRLSGECKWQPYGPVQALDLDGRPFVFCTNGPCLIAAEGTLSVASAYPLPDDMKDKFRALLRTRAPIAAETTVEAMRTWARVGEKSLCETCDGEGGYTDRETTNTWVPCTACDGKPFLRRYGFVVGFLFDLELLSEALGGAPDGPISIGVNPRNRGVALIIRSAKPLWKVLLMNVEDMPSRDAAGFPRFLDPGATP